MFNQRSQDLVRQADSVSRTNIEHQTNQINSDWKNLVSDLENRIENLKGLSQHWEEFDKRIHLLENQLARLDERSRNVDSVVRSKRHLEDTKNVIQVSALYHRIFLFTKQRAGEKRKLITFDLGF